MSNIREYRNKLGLKQSELCKLIDVAPSTISMWETGESQPRVETLKKLAEIFGCTVDDLLKDDQPDMKNPLPQEWIVRE